MANSSRSSGALPSTRKLGAIGLLNVVLLGLSVALEIGNILLLTGRLSAEDFDGYALTITLAMLLGVFPNSWYRLDFGRNLRKSLDGHAVDRRRQGSYYALALTLLTLTLVSLAGFAGLFETAGFGHICLAGLSALLLVEVQYALRTAGRLRLAPILDLAGRLVFLAFLLTVPLDLERAVLGYALSRLVPALLGMLALPWSHLRPALPSWAAILDLLRHYRWLFFSVTAEYAMAWGDVYLLEWLAGGRQIGGVFLAMRMLAVGVTAISVLGDIMQPRMLQASHDGEITFERTALRSLTPLLAASTASMALVGIAGATVGHLLVGERLPSQTLVYLAGALPILSLVPFVVVARTVFAGRNWMRPIGLGLLAGVAAKVTIAVVALPTFGPSGVCLAMVASYLATMTAFCAALRPVHSFLSPLRLAAPALAAGGAATVAVVTRLDPVPTLLAVAVGLTIHLVQVRVLGLVRQEDISVVSDTGIPRIGQRALALSVGRRVS